MVAELCARLDGMPLAIELAAARSASLGAGGLLAALDDHLRLLAGGRGPDERHRSLRAVIGWSHDLLDEEERALFRRLAAFVGGFDLDAAVAVTPDGSGGAVADVLGRLVDKSLVVHLRTAGRWRLLETVRAFALDQLAADGAHAITTLGQAFELLVASAERARAAGDGNARAVALAYAVVTADRFPSGFPTEVPHERLSALLAEAAAAGDPADPEVAAYLAAAAAWNAHGDKISPDPALSEAAAAAARATGDPVLISGGLDAVGTVAVSAGRLREAHRIASERLAMLATMPRNDPYSAAEIVDTFHVASTYAVAAGDLAAAMATARLVLHDDLLGDHPYLSTSKLVPPLVLTGELHEALRHAATMWDGWRRAGSPAAAWMAPAVSAVALGYGLLGEEERFGVWRARAVQVAGVAQAAQSRNLASFASFVDARVALHLGRLDGAAALVDAALGARLERACTLLLPARAPEGRDELAALGCPPPAC